MEIFRSWNWPSDSSFSYSKRPTPYNISKSKYISPGVIYKAWNIIFGQRYVRKVVFLPVDDIVHRKSLLFTNVTHKLMEKIASQFSNLYFVELLHYGHIYASYGSLSNIRNGGEIILVTCAPSSDDLIIKQAGIIQEFLSHRTRFMALGQGALSSNHLSEMDMKLLKILAYRDIYNCNLDELTPKLKISARTLRKRIDSVLEKKVLSLYPILDQTAFVGFNVAIIAILLDPAYDTTVMMDSVLRLKTVSDLYLLYMLRNGMVTVLVYYESLRDLDNCIQEVKEHYDNFAVFTKFETLLNEHIVIDSDNNNGHWE